MAPIALRRTRAGGAHATAAQTIEVDALAEMATALVEGGLMVGRRNAAGAAPKL